MGASPLAAVPKPHTVFLGSGRLVSYSIVGDPAGALPDEKATSRPPTSGYGKVKEWTNGEAHAITDRTFVIRRALRLNDSLRATRLNTGSGNVDPGS